MGVDQAPSIKLLTSHRLIKILLKRAQSQRTVIEALLAAEWHDELN
jgi:hypothetical protein